MIDNTSYIPKYIQVKEKLKEYIMANNLKEGDALPSENDLLQKYQVSRNTIRQAFNLLDKEGIIYTIRGKGTFYRGDTRQNPGGSSLIGVMTPVTSTSIYMDIVKGIEHTAHDNGFHMIWSNSMANPEKERESLEGMIDKGIDGLIIEPALSSNIVKDSYIYQKLQNLPIPVVIIDCQIEGLQIPSVTLDDCQYGYLATGYLIKRNHRKIGYIYKHETMAGKLRYEGYVKALIDAGIHVDPQLALSFTERADQNHENPVMKLTEELMKKGDPPTALFFFNDETAFEGIQSLSKLGLRVPEDVSVIGIDDSPFATLSVPKLTTLSHPKGEMGQKAAEILIEKIKNPETEQDCCIMMQPEIIERESVMPRGNL